MDSLSFRKAGKCVIDYVADYIDTIKQRRVVPDIKPNFLKELIPLSAPYNAESFETVMKDFNEFIMPNIAHWQHPHFHGYFSTSASYPSLLGDLLGNAVGGLSFTWAASPAATELELITLDWLGKMIGLPPEFLYYSESSRGGGVIQNSASDATYAVLLAARHSILKQLTTDNPFLDESDFLPKLVAYCSEQSHASVEKDCNLGMIQVRAIETDSQFRMRGEALRKAVVADLELGLIPFFVVVTLGTTSACAFDALDEIGPLCKQYNLYLHVDAAYGGCAMVCPEFRYLMKGIEYASSVVVSTNKMMCVGFDCATMWVKDRFEFTSPYLVKAAYLHHEYKDAVDYRDWGIPLSRRFRALKLWFVIRIYGIEGLQKHVRQRALEAKKFEELLKADGRFDVVNQVILGLVCFRLKDSSDNINKRLLVRINESGLIHMVPAQLGDKFVIRMNICSERTTLETITESYNILSKITDCSEVTNLIPSNVDRDVPCSNESGKVEGMKATEVLHSQTHNVTITYLLPQTTTKLPMLRQEYTEKTSDNGKTSGSAAMSKSYEVSKLLKSKKLLVLNK